MRRCLWRVKVTVFPIAHLFALSSAVVCMFAELLINIDPNNTQIVPYCAQKNNQLVLNICRREFGTLEVREVTF